MSISLSRSRSTPATFQVVYKHPLFSGTLDGAEDFAKSKWGSVEQACEMGAKIVYVPAGMLDAARGRVATVARAEARAEAPRSWQVEEVLRGRT